MTRSTAILLLLLAAPCLAPAAPPTPAATARAWLGAKHDAARTARLEVLRESPAGRGGRIVHFQERAAGRPVFDSDCRLLVAPGGAVTCLEDRAVPVTGNAAPKSSGDRNPGWRPSRWPRPQSTSPGTSAPPRRTPPGDGSPTGCGRSA
ncbi:MAG: hypothetical protein U1F77_05430 [Kiritimatiellia bacterium]